MKVLFATPLWPKRSPLSSKVAPASASRRRNRDPAAGRRASPVRPASAVPSSRLSARRTSFYAFGSRRCYSTRRGTSGNCTSRRASRRRRRGGRGGAWASRWRCRRAPGAALAAVEEALGLSRDCAGEAVAQACFIAALRSRRDYLSVVCALRGCLGPTSVFGCF